MTNNKLIMNSQAYQSERGVLVGQEALEAHGVLADFHLGLPKIKKHKKNCQTTELEYKGIRNSIQKTLILSIIIDTIIMTPKILTLSPLVPGVPGKPGGPT